MGRAQPAIRAVDSTASSKKAASRSGFVRGMAQQVGQIREHLAANSASLLRQARDRLAANLGREVPSNEAADIIAQAIVCAAPILAAAPDAFCAARSWLADQLQAWERFALEKAEALSTLYSALVLGAPAAHLYEHFLQHYAGGSRKRGGVFFTPQSIADYIVAQIDWLLREDCGAANGLAAENALLVDPACGTGIFLLTVIDYIHRRFMARWKKEQCGQTAALLRWNEFVSQLLSRLIGIEILPAAALFAKLNIAIKLAETGYGFGGDGRINVITGDALSLNVHSEICNLKSKLPVILGNPPFSSLSTTTNDWIARLVRGDDDIRGYVRANGQSLGERKTWLHDDYVKFIRLAQWHIENAGGGIVGFVTNHGYLDNATFRLMRHELLRVFPRIKIVDLHGNRKKHEVAPDGSRDENVFGLDQGVAIGLFCRPPTQTRSVSEGFHLATLSHNELWGSRTDKLRALTSRDSSLTLPVGKVVPVPPDWRFTPTQNQYPPPEYAAAWSLADAMPVNASAPVTARDHFVVAFTAEELRTRIEQFCDLTIPDDEIRNRFFHRTRSARYQLGDSRGWKLAEARRLVAADDHWPDKIVRCLYRPFDWRYVFWHSAMIDWPRTEVTQHLMEAECGIADGLTANDSAFRPPHSTLCLIARRQQLPTQPCTFFWITDGLALDGVIRSDNRGSESLFPLYLRAKDENGNAILRANFAETFIDQFRAATGLEWVALGSGDRRRTFGPEDVLAYVYAIFHSSLYRTRFAEELRVAFPRVVPPRGVQFFEHMCDCGRELIQLHLLQATYSAATLHLPPPIAAFRAGGYVALRKWLQPPHRSTSDLQYERIVAAIARTIEVMEEIDRCVAGALGSGVFGGKD